MRFFLGLLIAGTSTVSAFIELSPRQTSYPQCAQACLAKADLGSCTVDEVSCLCQEQAFIVSTTQCFEQNCDSNDLKTAEEVAQQTCEAAGVTLTSSIPAPSATASSKPKSNGAASTMISLVGGAAALGLAALVF